MLRLFHPDYYFEKYSDITPDFLIKNDIKILLLDVDNTLAPYEQAEPNEDNLSWFNALDKAGIKYAFISNNSSDRRIKTFNARIGAPAFAKSGKPFAKRTIERALNTLGGKKRNAAFVGDQVFTDVCAGKFNGMRSILVPPIKDKKNTFFRFKRALEKPILKDFFKRHKRR